MRQLRKLQVVGLVAVLVLDRTCLTHGAILGREGGSRDAIGRPDTNPDYHVASETRLEEFGMLATTLTHKTSNATILSFDTTVVGDLESAFMICFSTPPTDDTGVSHIFEHCALGGSSTYPLKEPFTVLQKSSLATYLNAATYPDMTCYPFASTNEKDFLNLMRVYLDGVFLPLAVTDGGERLAREGWHYELSDIDGELTYEGVVFSEMEGVYSQHVQLIYQHVVSTLLPSTPYHYHYGGLPDSIPNLTFEKFVNFFRRHYDPSNAVAFVYGPQSALDPRLSLLSQYLEVTSPLPRLDSDSRPTPRPNDQNPHEEPFRVKVPFAPTGDTPADAVVVAWLLDTQNLSAVDYMSLDLLSKALVGTPAAPLYSSLKSNGSVVLDFGLEGFNRQMIFVVGIDGIDNDDVQGRDPASVVESVILRTIGTLASAGFSPASKLAAMNLFDFEHRESLTGSRPSGFNFFHLAIAGKNNADDYFHFFDLSEIRSTLQSRMDENPFYLEGLLRQFLVENPSRVTVHGVATPKLLEIIRERRRSTLAAAKASMSADALMDIIKATKNSRTASLHVDSPELVSVLPHLEIADISLIAPPLPTTHRVLLENAYRRVHLVQHSIETSGIMYVRVALSLESLKFDDIPYIRLLMAMMEEAGTADKPEDEWISYVNSVTGGVSTGLISGSRSTDPHYVADGKNAWSYVVVGGKCLSWKLPELLDIMRNVVHSVIVDNQALARRLVQRDLSETAAALISQGHSFAAKRAVAGLTLSGWFADQTGGIGQYHHSKMLAVQIEDDWQRTLAHLERLQRAMRVSSHMIMDVVARDNDLVTHRQEFDVFAEKFDASSSLQEDKLIVARRLQMMTDDRNDEPMWVIEARQKVPIFSRNGGGGDFVAHQQPPNALHELFPIPSSVGYLALVSRLLEPGQLVSPAFAIAAKALSNGYLWENVRLANSAYGVWVRWDGADGIARFGSYRDPNVTKSIDVFYGSGTAADELSRLITEREMTNLKISVIGGIDRPMAPSPLGEEGLLRFIKNENDDIINERRQKVLDASRSDLKQFSEVLSSSLHEAVPTVALARAER